MNVGPASTVWPVPGDVTVEKAGGREASASGGDPALVTDEVFLSEDESGPKKKMSAREALQLLTEGRGMEEVRFRAGSRTEGEGIQNAPERKGSRENTGGLSTEFYDALRDLLNSGLFDEDVRAVLEEAFAPGQTDTEGVSDEESIDAERLHREMQEAFERFHASLKRIFRIAEAAEEGESEEHSASGSVEAHAEAAAVEEIDDAEAERSEEITQEYEEFVREMITTVQEALEDPQGDEDSTDERSSLIELEEGRAYERFISAYEELYDRSSERPPSFSTEG